MSAPRGRLLTIAIVAGVLALAAPVGAQEWKIYLVGKADPIVATYYAEEAPWVFYRDDDSMYLFTLGCNRISKVERGGALIPPPPCPVDRLATTASRVYVNVLELEAKRLDDGLAKLRELTTAYNAAVANASIAAVNTRAGGAPISIEGLNESLQLLRLQLGDARSDVDLSLQRTDALTQAIGAYREIERRELGRQRYFFAPR